MVILIFNTGLLKNSVSVPNFGVDVTFTMVSYDRSGVELEVVEVVTNETFPVASIRSSG